MTTYTIGPYTGQYDDGITPVVTPSQGETVKVDVSPDAREWDAFRRRLRETDTDIEYLDNNTNWNLYKIVGARE